MAPKRDLELEIGAWLASTPTLTSPPDLHAASITALHGRRQSPRWLAQIRAGGWPERRPQTRTLAMAALLAVIVIGTVVAVGIAGAKLQRAAPSTVELQSRVAVPPTPGVGIEQQNTDFAVPFAYTIPPESGLRADVMAVTELLGWSSGDPVPGPSLDPTAAQVYGPPANAAHGVMIGVGPIWGHGSTCCPPRATPGGSGRYQLRTDPAGFLNDLDKESGVPMGAIEQTAIDGRPATAADVQPGGTDLHFGPVQFGLTGGGYMFRYPSRLVAIDVNGRLVFVQIWAQTKAGLDEWLPTAMRFVESIRFLEPSPTPGNP